MCIDVVLIQVTVLLSDLPKTSDNFPNYRYNIISMLIGNFTLFNQGINHVYNKRSST